MNKPPGVEIHRMSRYTRSAAHIYGRKFDNTPVECAQIIFHSTQEDGTVWTRTHHVVKVTQEGDVGKWQAGNTGLYKVYFYINHKNLTPELLGHEIIAPPPPPEPVKKKRRRRRKRNRKVQSQASEYKRPLVAPLFNVD